MHLCIFAAVLVAFMVCVRTPPISPQRKETRPASSEPQVMPGSERVLAVLLVVTYAVRATLFVAGCADGSYSAIGAGDALITPLETPDGSLYLLPEGKNVPYPLVGYVPPADPNVSDAQLTVYLLVPFLMWPFVLLGAWLYTLIWLYRLVRRRRRHVLWRRAGAFALVGGLFTVLGFVAVSSVFLKLASYPLVVF